MFLSVNVRGFFFQETGRFLFPPQLDMSPFCNMVGLLFLEAVSDTFTRAETVAYFQVMTEI